MYRITAINEETDTEDEDDTKVTKEAEETIVVSEYRRALQMEKENAIDDALFMFSELLETQVLYEVTKDHTDKTLISIKYNCLKNIGFIYNKKGEKETALEFLLKAIELDDSDVFTLNLLGQAALQIQQLNVAQMAFEKCLKQNPNHWPSGDGILQILCMREDYNEAYGWALMWYEKNPNYTRGLDVILEIREKFQGFGGLEYIENCWSLKFKNMSLKRTNKDSVFPRAKTPELQMPDKPDILDFKIESFASLNWLTFGEFIANVYDYLATTDDGIGIGYKFSHNDFLLNKTKSATPEPVKEEKDAPMETDAETETDNITENDIPMEEKPESNSDSNDISNNPEGGNSNDGGSTEDSTQDVPTNSEDSSKPNAKPKSRRRGSDLKLLEPWCYWDRNRKYSQRQKNKQIERMENDTSINGLLRKILTKYFEENFDGESPFHPNEYVRQDSTDSTIDDNENYTANRCVTLESFQAATDDSFSQLIKGIEENDFTVIDLVTKWIKYISKFWERKMPDEVVALYIKLYLHHTNHYDLSTWLLLDENDFKAAFRMALFYLEISHQKAMQLSELNSQNEVDEKWFIIFNHLIFQSGFHDFDPIEADAIKYQKRVEWLQYCLARYEYDLRRSVNSLESIRDLCIAHDEKQILFLPNNKLFNRIDVKTVNESIIMLERTISLNNVQELYEKENYLELISTLKDSLNDSTKAKNSDDAVMKISTQFEIILECFWNLEMFDDCLIWSERCLKYALDRFISTSKDSPLYNEWSKNINFILTYIEALILNESYLIVNCLKKYYARLIQSIVRIVSNQLDAPQEKNNNPTHPIDIKMPWIILHHVLQREEDMQSHLKRKLSNDSNESNENDMVAEEAIDATEDTIPKSIAIFFTAHEYLGSRSWCTRDKGQLLLYVMEMIVPRLRTPELEAFRYIITDYLEQVTYCLYGYPAKRARNKHIEEHDAQNVDLEWNQAIQLYDLYRPDVLPEFDSFKNDSITSEMEQLLQRILAIIPPEMDSTTHVTDMEKFIGGELDELPKPLDILPYRINSIYYLLADHYFKNRDISKTVKYYVLDLSNCPTRFDAWAGLALSKASIMETKLNACSTISTEEWIQQSEEVLRCFKQCLKIDSQILSLWIEYGNYAYALHSYCSRCLKQSSDTLSMEKFSFLEAKKEECLKIAHDCFTTTDQFNLNQSITGDSDDRHEKWLYHYMLGKVAEKRKMAPNIVIDHYLKSAKYLYEHNATYPFKISFSNPQNLSLEALEIFYRITATIIKYMEQHSVVTHGVGKYFLKILKQQAKSPFAINQAKINENSVNAFKRKLSLANEEAAKQKMTKLDMNVTNVQKSDNNPSTSEEAKPRMSTETPNDATKISTSVKVESMETDDGNKMETELPTKIECKMEIDDTKMVEKQEMMDSIVNVESLSIPCIKNIIDENVDSPLRRGSQESTATTTTQTTTTTGTGSSSSTSSDSDSTTASSSDDDSSSEDDANKDEHAPLDEKNVDTIYRMCIKNLEECVTRFAEHYKSIYRLVTIYMNGPEKLRSTEKCNQLLLGTYTTELGNQIQGLFTDRKNNNLFNGIWRNPSSDIDRPGSFSSHLSKCVNILMQTLRLNADYKLFLEIIFHLMRVPDADKRYIKDSERKDLLEHAYSFCAQSFRDLLKRHSVDKPDDNEMLTLIVEIFKAHKKCFKNVVQKDSPFSGVLVEAYKAYIQGKVDGLPDTVNYIELATKLCVYEINAKKNQDKQNQQTGKRHLLDELGFGGLAASLSKLNNTYSGASGIGCTIQPVLTATTSTSTVTVTVTTTKIATPNVSTVVTMASSSVPATSTTTSLSFIPSLPNRPRGRPPGSRNVNVKSNETKKPTIPASSLAAPSISNLISYLLKPLEPSSFSGRPLPNLNHMTAHLEPSIRTTVLMLFKENAFMKTLAQFQDPPSMTIFLSEYFRFSNLPNIPQLMSGFMGVLNMLAASLQQPTSLPTSSNSQMKASKMDVSSSMSSKTSEMSIFPVSSKPQSSLSTVSTKTKTSSATITPVTSPSALQSTSLLKTNVSTVLNVGSGQLTITPSISITPNIPPPSMHTPLMQMPNFSQNAPQILPVKMKQKPGPKPGSKHTSKTGLKPGPKPKNTTTQRPSLPIDHLPKSLSIIPQSSTFVQPQLTALMGSEAFVGKSTKQSKPRKKSVDGNSKVNAKTNIPQMKAPNFAKQTVAQQLESQLLFNQYQELLRSNPNGPNFMAQFEQFLTGAVPSELAKVAQQRASNDSIAQSQKIGLKVKKLEQLQATSSTAKQNATSTTSKQGQKSNKPTFTSPPSGIAKNQPMISNTTVLNAFGTTISSRPHLAEQMAHPYSAAMLTTQASLPAGLQISPTKSLQQKLAERQKQFNESNCPSRPSSASSAGSAKTPKSDNNVIVLD